MNKMLKIVAGLSITAMLLGSCSKSFIERTPYGSVSPDVELSSTSGLKNALDGLYGNLRRINLYGRDFPIMGDLMADNTFVEARNSGRYLSIYNYSFTVADQQFGEIWQSGYQAITNANRIIDATVTGSDADAIKAQAYGVRALLYFKLVNIYAKPYTDDPNALGVPLVLHYSPYDLPGRAKVGEVYNQIVADLKQAFQTAPDYTSSATLSKYAIEGLLAKVYLYMGNNALAKSSAIDVINKSGIDLLTYDGYLPYWADPASSSDQEETLFEIDVDVINNNGFDDYAGMYIFGYDDIYPSRQLVSLYSNTDIRSAILVPGTTKGGANAFINVKFQNAQNTADRDNIKVLRMSEVYLIAAEASLPGDEVTARKYLNALVAERDPAFPGYLSTGTTLLNDIVQERRKELAFEGDRFYDLNRLKRPVVRLSNSGAISAGTGNVNLTIPYPDNRRVGPIPQTEVQANPTIAGQQNPGY